MKAFSKHLLATAATCLTTLLGSNAHALVTTGTLTGWNVLGDVISQTGVITMTTAYLDGGEDQPSNLSGHSAVDIATLESAAGVAPFALDLSADEYGTEGSMVGQSFAASAGQTLSFDWAFTTLETLFEDRAFAVIGGKVVTLATMSMPGAATQRFSFTFGTTGTETLSLGVIDTVDYLGVSSLKISNLQLTAAAIPEPSTWLLLAGGLAGLGWAARRRQAPG